MLSYAEQIENKINDCARGKVFIANDFLDIASYETVRKTLNRLTNNDKIKRILKGFYYNPSYNELIREYEAPSMHELAIAIARKYNWDIAPYSTTALNFLGLSTQVPSKLTYISSGRNKEYQMGNNVIAFKKTRPAEIANMSFVTATVIQAVKTLGKDKITEKTIQTISHYLSQKEKRDLMNEATSVAAWIYKVIRKICEDKNE